VCHEASLLSGPIYTNEDDGFRFIAESLLNQLKADSSEKKTLYIHKARDNENGKIITASEKIRLQSTHVFHQSGKFSVLQSISDKQADYIMQGTLFLENLPSCFWKAKLGKKTKPEEKYVLRVVVLDSKERVVRHTHKNNYPNFLLFWRNRDNTNKPFF